MLLSRHTRRREVISLIGGVAASWPLAARAQQPAMPVIGFLHSHLPDTGGDRLRAFRLGLKETGYVEGQNVAVEYHSAGGDPDRLRSLVTDMIRRRVAAIAGNTVAMQAAKSATTTIPIVFFTGGDPVEAGLVASLNRPGGNITGINFLGAALGAKRPELLRKLVPNATKIGLLANPSPDAEWEQRDVQAAAQAVGQQLVLSDVVVKQSITSRRDPIIDRTKDLRICVSVFETADYSPGLRRIAMDEPRYEAAGECISRASESFLSQDSPGRHNLVRGHVFMPRSCEQPHFVQ
jgi:ABC-type sugar transport system substrate-binding protein